MIEDEFPRVNVLGVGVHAINMEQAVDYLLDVVARRQRGYVCVTGVHGIMEAQHSPRFRRVLNESLLTTPDGMPTVWVGKIEGYRQMGRVYGPDLMLNICRESVKRGYTHFLYGGGPGVAEKLKRNLEAKFPGIKIVGTCMPPYHPLHFDEHCELCEQVSIIKPDIFWVGLSTPKQERFMADYFDRLDTRLMIGVGAAFDFHTGRMADAPDWVKNAGMQWAHRLIQDPRRLWRRYLVNNPKFLVAITAQLLGIHHYQLPSKRRTIITQKAA